MGEFRLASRHRRSHTTASASAPRTNLVKPRICVHRKAPVSRGESRSASWTWASVSAPRPINELRQTYKPWASAKLRSSANACSHSECPGPRGSLHLHETQKHVGPSVLGRHGESFGQHRFSRYKARVTVVDYKECSDMSHHIPVPTKASIFPGSSAKPARKNRALAPCVRESSPYSSNSFLGKQLHRIRMQ